jgi:hypothetical protein
MNTASTYIAAPCVSSFHKGAFNSIIPASCSRLWCEVLERASAPARPLGGRTVMAPVQYRIVRRLR